MESHATDNSQDMIFEDAELALKIKIPKYLKNLLILNGFDTGPVIATITELDLKEIESFAKSELIDKSQLSNIPSILVRFMKKDLLSFKLYRVINVSFYC